MASTVNCDSTQAGGPVPADPDTPGRVALDGTLPPVSKSRRRPPAPAGSAASAGSAARAPEGLFVGPYELLARIGEGGMGVVHLARRPGGERVALKVLRPHVVGDQESRERLAREVGSLERVTSTRVAGIVDADPWGDIPYVATRYVPGLSLHDHVAQEGPVTGGDLTWLAHCLAEALAAVHEVGVLHRDVKPSNVLMEGRSPVLIDFGLARVADDPTLTRTGWLLGTPGYLAPEVLAGEAATEASEVHSWAATVCFAALGRPPFGRGPAMAVMDRVRRGEHDVSGLEEPMAGLVRACLATEASARPGLAVVRAEMGRSVEQQPGPPRRPVEAGETTMPLRSSAPSDAAGRDRDAARVSSAGAGVDDQAIVAGAVAAPEPGTAVASPPARTAVMSAAVPASARERTDPEGPGRWQTVPAPPPRPEGWTRLRRALLVGVLVLPVSVAVAAVPYVATAVLVLLVVLLRAGWQLAGRHRERQGARGRRWYDVVLVPLSAPWHLLVVLPGSLLLLLWAGGAGLVTLLICYALSLQLELALLAVGATVAGALWVGPGSAGVRGPVLHLTRPAAATSARWVVAVFSLLVVAVVITVASGAETSWVPAEGPPLRDWEWRDLLPG